MTSRPLRENVNKMKAIFLKIRKKIKKLITKNTINIIKINKYSLFIPDDMIWAFNGGDYYEKNVIFFFDKIIEKYKNPVLFDVGANYGYYSLRYSPFCKNVFSFEPVTQTYKVLAQNIKKNRVVNIVSMKIGLSDLEEERTINLYNSSGNNSIYERKIPPEHSLKKTGVEIIKLKVLDDLVRSGQIEPPNIIKIDVEGAELNVLKGAKNTILVHRPTILIEYSVNTSSDAGYDRDAVFNIFDFKDYLIYGISEDVNNLELICEKDIKQSPISNLIFLPKEVDFPF
jgi:FkbM family methyltransferase